MQISNIINLQSGKGRFFCRKMFHKVFWMTNLASLGLVAANIMDAVVVGRQMGHPVWLPLVWSARFMSFTIFSVTAFPWEVLLPSAN